MPKAEWSSPYTTKAVLHLLLSDINLASLAAAFLAFLVRSAASCRSSRAWASKLSCSASRCQGMQSAQHPMPLCATQSFSDPRSAAATSTLALSESLPEGALFQPLQQLQLLVAIPPGVQLPQLFWLWPAPALNAGQYSK